MCSYTDDSTCVEIDEYEIHAYKNTQWVKVNDGTLTTTVGDAMLSDRKGQLTDLRIVAINAKGAGYPSDVVQYTPSALPSASQLIDVNEDTGYGPSHLLLEWTVPLDTGADDSTTVPITHYELQVDEGFGNGFVPLTFDYPYLTYKHESLILGHRYAYRIRAQNLMGFGTLSDTYEFIPRSEPKRPLHAPLNRATLTNRNVLYIEYDTVH
jgi:hypothetical protein